MSVALALLSSLMISVKDIAGLGPRGLLRLYYCGDACSLLLLAVAGICELLSVFTNVLLIIVPLYEIPDTSNAPSLWCRVQSIRQSSGVMMMKLVTPETRLRCPAPSSPTSLHLQPHRTSPCATPSHTVGPARHAKPPHRPVPSAPFPTNISTAASPSSSSASAPLEPDLASSRLNSAQLSQRRSTELLARLLEASDPTGVAREAVEGLTEEFFMTAGTYLTLAQKEGNAEVVSRLERALNAAWRVKQSTLRPELQLLNSLVRAPGEADRRQIYAAGGSDLLAILSMNGRWFAGTLARMTADVERQPAHAGRADLLARLQAIKRETEALEKQAARQARRGAAE